MKKVLLLIAIILGLGFVSCTQPDTREVTTTVIKNTTTTITEPGTDGFLLKKQVVVHGNTVWGFTQKAYGTGTNWREVVAQNPFLQQPGRVYYDDVKKMWIVLIYPGEVLKLGGEIINPTYVVEETTTTTTVTKPAPTVPLIPLWGWLLIIGLALLFVVLSHWPIFASSSSSSSSTVRIDMNGQGFDLATRRTILEREQEFRNRTLKVIEDGATSNRLKSFFVAENPDIFMAGADFRKNQATEIKKEEDKK